MKKLRVTSGTGHFGTLLGYDDRRSYKVPPVSTVLGMLKVIYGDDIIDKEFKFGYIFRDEGSFKDAITIYKFEKDKGKYIKNGDIAADCRFIEYRQGCELIIYTDLNRDLKMEYILNMGRTDNLAVLELPVRDVDLVNKEGAKCYNVLTPKHIGNGKILRYNMLSKYNIELGCYDHQTELLRFNKEIALNKNYDKEEAQSVFLWEYRDGEVLADVY